VNDTTRPLPAALEAGWIRLELKSVLDHEVVVLEG